MRDLLAFLLMLFTLGCGIAAVRYDSVPLGLLSIVLAIINHVPHITVTIVDDGED